VQVQESGFIERNLGVSIAEESSEQIFQCRFNRFPLELSEVLKHGPALRRCRETLQEHGYSWRLASGAIILVHPHQYDPVMESISPSLAHRDVVVPASLESLLEQDLGSIRSISGSFRGAWVNARKGLIVDHNRSLAGSVCSVEGEVARSAENTLGLLSVQRGFLCSLPLRRQPAAVTQSEPTDGLNPRCALVE